MRAFLSHAVVALLTFVIGNISARGGEQWAMLESCPVCTTQEALLFLDYDEAHLKNLTLCPTCPSYPATSCPICPSCTAIQKQPGEDAKIQIPRSMANAFAGFGRIDRESFNERFDVGVPFEKNKAGNTEVLMIYTDAHGFPSNYSSLQGPIPKLNDAQHGTDRCNTLKVIYKRGTRSVGECLAIVQNQEDFRVHSWTRQSKNPKEQAKTRPPLRNVGRLGGAGTYFIEPPPQKKVAVAQKLYSQYLGGVDKASQNLKVIARKVAKNNTIVAMTANFGDFDLFVNFICSARSRDIDTSQILLFSTDATTHKLAMDLGVASFYDSEVYKGMPMNAANSFGDATFQKMALAKVYCVHLLSKLGYSTLFQDIDVVWYRDPVPYFTELIAGGSDFDLFFQDDGSRGAFYLPYFACAGFFYMKSNQQTQFFVEEYLKRGDEMRTQDQEVLNQVLTDLAARYGLRTKVLERDNSLFPTGYHYQIGGAYMKRFIQGQVKPFIFHMNWTKGRKEKLEFFRQMGMWFLSDQYNMTNETSLRGMDYCVAKPTSVCNYKDLPSTVPCHLLLSTYNPRGRSFWKVHPNGTAYL